MKAIDFISRKLRHFWHEVSNIRPIVWILLYLCLVPLFALFYWLLPDSQFRIPGGSGAGYGDWLYYSIVTVTTLGFGDYTPSGAASQWITAVEVLCGLVTIGFFLNAVGSMKSEIDVESEIDKQKRVHEALEKDKLIKNIPVFISKINQFLLFCYAVTTPLSKRSELHVYNENFSLEDLSDMHKPSGLPQDHSQRSALTNMLNSAKSLSLFLDSLQLRIDLSQWQDLLDNAFKFVANFDLLIYDDEQTITKFELIEFIRANAKIARNMETALTAVASVQS